MPKTRITAYHWTGEPDDPEPDGLPPTGWLPWDERGSAMYELSRVRVRRFRASLVEVT